MRLWEKLLQQARKLPESELARNASVSFKNRHKCEECFCCACFTVCLERNREDEA
jgi:hypothetical protein